MMLYIDLQHHGAIVKDIPNLLLLESRDVILNVSIDTGIEISPKLIEKCNSLKFHSATVAVSQKVSWGGISVVNQIIAALEKALKSPDWDFFVTLSGSCCPLMPMSEINNYLMDRLVRDGVKGYTHCFSLNEPQENFSRLDLSGRSIQTNLGRAEIFGDEAVISLIQNGIVDPVRRTAHRRSLKYVEVDKNLFEVSLLSSSESQNSLEFSRQFGYLFGRQWVILHREVVDWMVGCGIVQYVRDCLERTFIPDESFFQSVLFGQESPFVHQLNKRNMWYRNGGPERLRQADIEKARAGNCMFARKFCYDPKTDTKGA